MSARIAGDVVSFVSVVIYVECIYKNLAVRDSEQHAQGLDVNVT